MLPCRFARFVERRHPDSSALESSLLFKTRKLELGNFVGSGKAVYSHQLQNEIEVNHFPMGLTWELQQGDNRYRFEVSRCFTISCTRLAERLRWLCLECLCAAGLQARVRLPQSRHPAPGGRASGSAAASEAAAQDLPPAAEDWCAASQYAAGCNAVLSAEKEETSYSSMAGDESRRSQV